MLLPLACAACTTVSVADLTNEDCSDYVPPQLWAPTPHAAPPGTSQASHGQFELGEAGQLEKSNGDKSATHFIITTCEQKRREATARAQQMVKPWPARIFSRQKKPRPVDGGVSRGGAT
jgi:hypothetical protein